MGPGQDYIRIGPAGEWAHIAATYDFDSDTLVAYINGLASEFYIVNPVDSINDDGTEITGGMGIDWFDNDGAFTGFGASGNGPLHADSAGDFTRLFYDGLLDEVAIWNEALTAEQILDIMENGVVGFPPRLQAGDADQDLDFDQLDLVKVQVAAKYLTGQAATWGDGDGMRHRVGRKVILRLVTGCLTSRISSPHSAPASI